jgi:hypothetical protein
MTDEEFRQKCVSFRYSSLQSINQSINQISSNSQTCFIVLKTVVPHWMNFKNVVSTSLVNTILKRVSNILHLFLNNMRKRVTNPVLLMSWYAFFFEFYSDTTSQKVNIFNQIDCSCQWQLLLGVGANRLFYMALPPSVFIAAATGIKATCMSKVTITQYPTHLFEFSYFHILSHWETDEIWMSLTTMIERLESNCCRETVWKGYRIIS